MKFFELSSFESWFNGSKVVDKHGRPLRMFPFHKEQHRFFPSATHFGSAKAARSRASFLTKGNPFGKTSVEGFKTYPVYLNIKNPLRVTDAQASEEASLLNAIKRGEYPKLDLSIANREGAHAAAQAAGYDGLVYSNNFEDNGADSWVIFDPSQVRFALSNMNEAVKKFPGLTPAFIKTIQKVRHEQRIENGGGGACHLVSEWIEWKYGWDRVSGTYTSPDYKEPQVTGHY